MRTLLAITFFALAALSGQALALTFTVGNAADIPDALPGDGKCSFIFNHPNPNDPTVCTLRAAIMEANATVAHDTIVLQAGITYLLTIPGQNEDNAATGDLDIRQPVTIRPPLFFGIPVGQATINANGLERVFDIMDVHGVGVTLIGLTIRGGNPTDSVRIFASKAMLSFLDISAIHGNGLGIYNNMDEETTVIYSTVSSGTEDNNDAIFVLSARAVIESSTIVDSTGYGINIIGAGSKVKVRNSTVSGNPDGGIRTSGTQADIDNSTIANNGIGGVISIASGAIVATNTLFASNGIGVNGNCLANGGTFQMKDNLYDDATCPPGGMIDNSLFNTPAFLSLLGDHGGPTPTHRPMVNSEALDFIAAADCPGNEYDQRGMPRQVAFTGGDARCDLGSVELETDVIFFDQVDRL